jgi:broad specificity phosphatase PhoE
MSPRTRLFLVRHGEVDSHWHGRIYGSLDVPLSAAGREEARRAARRLAGIPLGAVISSGLERTEHGAAYLRAARRLPRLDDRDLRELDRGAWAGLSLAELELRSPGSWSDWFRSPATRRPPGGESLEDLLARVRPRVLHWVALHPGAAVALVTHGWVIRVLVCHALGLALDLAPRLDIRTADVVVLDWPGAAERPELRSFAADDQLSE